MKVRYEPQEPESGVISLLTWNHPALADALREAFNVSPREELVQIDVTRDGIRAYFQTVNAAIRKEPK